MFWKECHILSICEFHHHWSLILILLKNQKEKSIIDCVSYVIIPDIILFNYVWQGYLWLFSLFVVIIYHKSHLYSW